MRGVIVKERTKIERERTRRETFIATPSRLESPSGTAVNSGFPTARHRRLRENYHRKFELLHRCQAVASEGKARKVSNLVSYSSERAALCSRRGEMIFVARNDATTRPLHSSTDAPRNLHLLGTCDSLCGTRVLIADAALRFRARYSVAEVRRHPAVLLLDAGRLGYLRKSKTRPSHRSVRGRVHVRNVVT